MTVHPDIQNVLAARGARRLSTMTVEEARADGPTGPNPAAA